MATHQLLGWPVPNADVNSYDCLISVIYLIHKFIDQNLCFYKFFPTIFSGQIFAIYSNISRGLIFAD